MQLTPVRVWVAHPLDLLLGLVEEGGDRARVADVPVALKCHTDLNSLVAPQVSPDVPAGEGAGVSWVDRDGRGGVRTSPALP